MRAESKVVSEGKLKLDAVLSSLGFIYGACFGTHLFCAKFTHNLLRKMTHSHPDLMNDSVCVRYFKDPWLKRALKRLSLYTQMPHALPYGLMFCC